MYIKTNTLTEEEKIFKAIEQITRKHIVSVVNEANKYCYKAFDGEIKAIDKAFVDDIAKGVSNNSKIN